jgi:hypothetical protein
MIDDDLTEAQVPPEAPLNGRSILFWFALLIALGIIFIGARFLFQPLTAATEFGVPARGSPSFAYLWAKGTRDIVSGLLLLAFLGVHAGRRLVAVFLAVAALIPLGDFVNVALNEGTRHAGALVVHGSTFVTMVILAAFLFATRAGARGRLARRRVRGAPRVPATAH